MDYPKTMTSNAAAGLLTAALLAGAACALWLGAPLLNVTVNDVFESDIPVVRLSHPQIAASGVRLEYSAVVAPSRKLALTPKSVPAPASPPAIRLSRIRTVSTVAKVPVAARKRTSTPVVVSRTAAALVTQAAVKVDAAATHQPRIQKHSSGNRTTATDRHRHAANAAHRGTSRRREALGRQRVS